SGCRRRGFRAAWSLQSMVFRRRPSIRAEDGRSESGDLSLETSCGLVQLRDECGRDLEQVADDAVVGHFEDRRVGVLVDGNDGARTLHADQMLNRTRDAQ